MPKKNNKNKGGKSKNSKSIISDIDDDFDNFLSEFKIDEEIETSDSINSDAIDVKKVNIIDVKFSSDYKGKINPNFIFLSTSYLKSIHDGYLIIKTEIEEVIDIDISYNIELRDYDNNLISSDTSSLDSKENTTLLPINSPIEGEYWLSISSNKTSIFRKKLTFVDVKDNYAKYLNLDTFSLYRINCDDNGDIVAMLKRGGRSCYNYDNLAGILLTAQFTSISELTLPCAITVIIENQENEIIFQENKEEILNKTESIQFITEIENIVCRTGNYLLKILFYDTIIIKTIFVVGQRDVRSSFRPAQLTPRSETGGLSISKITPRQKLESMIGLKRVKKQLKGAIAKSQLKKARNKFNLPANKQQLHFAFMGSPGTGKTTVAKLLGAIYKEIGVLSRGHVVLRDRASLMTQNWGGEGELVNLALDEAKGGILFIDEAYDLITEHKSDPGKLVLSSLLSTMADDNNRDIMIILAGYTAPMERLLSKNPGVLSRVTRIYFEDYKEDELMQIADLWLGNNCYKLTSDARKYLQSVISNAYASRNDFFGNARYINNLLETEIQPAMANRIMNDDPESLTYAQLTTIEASDIPNYTKANADAEDAIKKLDNMVGLNSLKKDIRSHLSYIKFVQARRNNHIDTPIPPLHMVFTGNPGTGKSSVAEYLGDIYRSMGILSVGNVIKVTRADMIDSAIGGTEEKMKELINAAHGNILFIDEAYTLFDESGKDYGKNAIEVLLDTLGKEITDMIVILAGYPNEMEKLLNINPGLKGRFPNIFNFEDYNEEELFQIAKGVLSRNSLTITKGGADALKAIIRKECKQKDSNFSNARFVVRLITTEILPNMARRLEGVTDPSKLKRILQRDIPIEHKDIKMINENMFDEDLIDDTLERLDSLVGLTKVKIAIHQFVDFARALNRKDPSLIDKYPLKWNFVGNTGTGKSSVAQILSEILKAMHLIDKGHTVEIDAEELYHISNNKADELMQSKMRESQQGLLFVDSDSPQFSSPISKYDPQYLRISLATNTKEVHGRFAVVIAENESPHVGFAKKLNRIGINNYNNILLFDDYTPEELAAILALKLKKHDLYLSDSAATIMYNYIKKIDTESSASEANARTMKDLSLAIFRLAATNNITSGIISDDIIADFKTLQAPRTKIGYFS